MWALAFSNMPNAPHYEDLKMKGEELIDLGCDDPLVLYCYGTALEDSGELTDAGKYIRGPITPRLNMLQNAMNCNIL